MQPDSFGDDGLHLMSLEEVDDTLEQLGAILAEMIGSQAAYERLVALADDVSELGSTRGSVQ